MPANTSTPRLSRRRVDGVLLLDKPQGITSNAALMRVKHLYRAEKAGHTGTLDPLASGLLPICFGSATRFAQFLLDAPKRYVATVRFGATTTTQDAEGEIVTTRAVDFAPDELERALARFIGRQMQTPPAHSALKFEGRPHYEYARRGIEVPRAPREVVIHALRLLHWHAPDATIEVECSKGTYVRALAADLGDALGCGAHLAALRRTASGGFDVVDALALDLIEAASPDARDRFLLPVSTLVASLPALSLGATEGTRFLHGNPVQAVGHSGCIAVFHAGVLLGVAEVVDNVAHARRVVATSSDPLFPQPPSRA